MGLDSAACWWGVCAWAARLRPLSESACPLLPLDFRSYIWLRVFINYIILYIFINYIIIQQYIYCYINYICIYINIYKQDPNIP